MTDWATILGRLVALLSTLPGLTVVRGIPLEVTALPLAYVAYAGTEPAPGAQLLRLIYLARIRVLVAWEDKWGASEDALAPWVDSIPALLHSIEGQDVAESVTVRAVRSDETGDGFLTIQGRAFRSLAVDVAIKG